MLAVGSDDPRPNAGGKVEIHEYSNTGRQLFLRERQVFSVYADGKLLMKVQKRTNATIS